MEETNKVEYRVRDLPTRSVTLFPSRAQVIREIKDVPLRPGNNEVVVVGLTPTVDEHSIKVEGTGSNAIITDISVQLLPNRELFQDLYPDSDEESDEDEEESERESDDDDHSPHRQELKKLDESLEVLREKLAVLRDDQHRAKETIASAAARLKLLDSFGESLKHKECKITIEDGLSTYREEREKVFGDHMDATIEERKYAKELADLVKEETKLKESRRKQLDKITKSKRKAREAKRKEKEKRLLRKAEKQKEKDRIRKEREQFWPRSCYTVRITLDSAGFTPSSSRRNSIASTSDLAKPVLEKAPASSSASDTMACDISLSYVTTSAYWSPSYDLALSTTSNTARLCFDASLTNMTCETWSNCKIILSNSQTTFFSFHNDVLPALKPWHVKLGGKIAAMATGVLDSREERKEKGVWNATQNEFASKPRAQLFGVGSNISNISNNNFDRARFAPQSSLQQVQQQAPLQVQQQNVGGFGGGFHSGPVARSVAFGSSSTNAIPPPPPPALSAPAGGLFGGSAFGAASSGPPPAPVPAPAPAMDEAAPRGHGSGLRWENEADVDGATILEPTPELSFQESSFEETGLTATFDLPSLKTLKPSSTASKQRVAHVTFTNIVFSRTVVAKYKPVAYLRAKLRNQSKLTLLKGPTGITLDGTFMGRSSLPRCSAGDFFTMSLGVDPAIKVSYPGPEVKRSTSGLFTKEDCSAYTRTITLLNTRAAAGKHVNVTVLDQVPVSEDEKLRVSILQPRGMSVGGTAVMTGAAGREGEKDWGRATAVLKKAGEVSWDVALNAGRSCKLTLEYEVALPAGEHVTQC
ncbi:hypothetical protein GQ53DRAFT_753611 [Thozetella sp. PMI_491]|nr:hypothetical protein GQ53DRAFT_753611 [Thozetella sp. PMI_491]